MKSLSEKLEEIYSLDNILEEDVINEGEAAKRFVEHYDSIKYQHMISLKNTFEDIKRCGVYIDKEVENISKMFTKLKNIINDEKIREYAKKSEHIDGTLDREAQALYNMSITTLTNIENNIRSIYRKYVKWIQSKASEPKSREELNKAQRDHADISNQKERRRHTDNVSILEMFLEHLRMIMALPDDPEKNIVGRVVDFVSGLFNK